MHDSLFVWDSLIRPCSSCFTRPAFALFCELTSAWVLCPGRRTITGMLRMLGPPLRRSHDAYHRFLRDGAWEMTDLWRVLADRLVSCLVPQAGVLRVDLDDTLFHKTGRRVEGAGVFRDAVRSTGRRVVYALGLNLVVATLRLVAPWGGEPLGLPVNVRLYRKGGPSHLDLAEQMLRQLADWFPHHRLATCFDGAYASLAGRRGPRTHVTSRMRRDAALYEKPPRRRQGTRGRPAKRGKRLPTPAQMAKRRRQAWDLVTIDQRGRRVCRLVFTREVLWYQVCRDQPVLLVVVRDPRGRQPDDFFFTTDLTATAAEVAGQYAGRWSIEDTFRNVKQLLGGEDPQCFRRQGPQRAAALSMWLYTAVWSWYIQVHGSTVTWRTMPWYRGKRTPSFADALAALRTALWRQRIFARSAPRALMPKMARLLIEALARAA